VFGPMVCRVMVDPSRSPRTVATTRHAQAQGGLPVTAWVARRHRAVRADAKKSYDVLFQTYFRRSPAGAEPLRKALELACHSGAKEPLEATH